ncbi:alpha/beta hydrolase [Streptomyces sp. NPDC093568]|uniref:alpha/beta hydrolase n=1 Tax=Streptomyces sp. NPDC093568 TaxID=3366041 RepID=UPI0037FD11AA
MVAPELDPWIAEVLRTAEVKPDLRSLRAPSAVRPVHDPLVRDDIAPLRGRSLPVRLYQGLRDDCVLVFFHGGGFVKGDLDSHDAQARTLREVTGRPVVSVRYRLAPEHRFPRAHEDAVEAVRWVHENAGALFDGAAARVAVVGSSAGANLALGAALALASSPSAPVAQLLACPFVSGDPALPSRAEFAEGYGLTSRAVEWFIEAYVSDPAQRQDPRFAPVLSEDLAVLPPTVLFSAALDPLRDDARVLLKRLRASGVHVLASEEPTLPHGYFKYAGLSGAAKDAVVRMNTAFRDLLDDLCADVAYPEGELE